MIFDLKIKPMGAVRQNRSDAWRDRPCVNEYRAFKDALRLHANITTFRLQDDMNYVFIIPMPDSWSEKKKKKMDGERHRQKPDFDNILKAVWDALEDDDSHISGVGASKKCWGREGRIIIF